MNARLTTIAQRRAVLVAKAAAQRDEIGRCIQPWRTPLSFVDRGAALVRDVRAHPLTLAIGMLMLFRRIPGRWGAWAGHLWAGWQIYQLLPKRQSRPRQ